MRHRIVHLESLTTPRQPRTTPVAVIFGADAQRRRACSDSARAIGNALKALGCEPVLVQTTASLAADLQVSGARTAVVTVMDERLVDGTVQELCADLGITCVGAAPAALRCAADKSVASSRMAECGVAVPPQRLFTQMATTAVGIGAILPRAVEALGPEVVIKPRWGSGGLGVKRVSAGNAAAAIVNTFNYDRAVIVERAIEGEEFCVLTAATADDPQAVGIAHVTYLSHDAQAAAWARRYTPVRGMPAELVRTVVGTACKAAWALGLAGLATVDLIVDDDGVAWAIDADGQLDWRPDGALSACLAGSDLSLPQLLANLLRDMGATMRVAA